MAPTKTLRVRPLLLIMKLGSKYRLTLYDVSRHTADTHGRGDSFFCTNNFFGGPLAVDIYFGW